MQSNFKGIDAHLSGPYSRERQTPIAVRFQHSAVRIRAIGDREYEVGEKEAPSYTRLESQWVKSRTRAVKVGYTIKTFIEYAYQR